MLELEVKGMELYDESKNEFIQVKPTVLRLEHSLVSISKWEAKWKKPFLVDKPPKTLAESKDYIRCMTLNQNVDPAVYECLGNSHMQKINEYIEDNKTATTFSDRSPTTPNRQIMTSELIYFYMAQYNLPIECQKWHLSRLLTLLRIASIKNAPEKKMSRNAVMAQNRALNAARRKAAHSKG